jgi:hypothetical protein
MYMAVKVKSLGYSKGTPDLIIPARRGDYAGLWIELKSERAEYIDSHGEKKIHSAGTLSDEQKEWLEYLKGEGYCARCATGFEEARKIIDAYLTMPTGK